MRPVGGYKLRDRRHLRLPTYLLQAQRNLLSRNVKKKKKRKPVLSTTTSGRPRGRPRKNATSAIGNAMEIINSPVPKIEIQPTRPVEKKSENIIISVRAEIIPNPNPTTVPMIKPKISLRGDENAGNKVNSALKFTSFSTTSANSTVNNQRPMLDLFRDLYREALIENKFELRKPIVNISSSKSSAEIVKKTPSVMATVPRIFSSKSWPILPVSNDDLEVKSSPVVIEQNLPVPYLTCPICFRGFGDENGGLCRELFECHMRVMHGDATMKETGCFGILPPNEIDEEINFEYDTMYVPNCDIGRCYSCLDRGFICG